MKVVFNPELEVPSKELCKRLRELGFPQKTKGGWYWICYQLTYKKDKPQIWKLSILDELSAEMKIDAIGRERQGIVYLDVVKAPTCRELGEWLLKVYLKFPTGHPMRNKLISFCLPLKLNPNILSKDLIWLAENGYVKFKKGDE